MLAAQPFCVHQRCIKTRRFHQLANALELLLAQRAVEHFSAADSLLITPRADGCGRSIDKVFAKVGIAPRKLALHLLQLCGLKAHGKSRRNRLGLNRHRQQLAAYVWPHSTHLGRRDGTLQHGLQLVEQIGIRWQLGLPMPGVQPCQLRLDLQALGIGEVGISIEIKISDRGQLVVANFHGTAG